ncbi:MAG: NAD-dependent epimerase [Candidatus Magnetoovum sp. WYHC-5]|nr:NAD-dependent epimerase [Candidatus Magnetoovum sp. WYHC-5]
MKKILVTGAAGFIGYHVCKKFIEAGEKVVGIDNLNDYYDVNLKKDRLKQLENIDNFTFYKIDLSDKEQMLALFKSENFNIVINLAAQAGVRYSIINPYEYINSNIYGFLNVLEGCRHNSVEHLIFASSSSVYGANTKMPFSVHYNVDHPVSLYAATKKSNELMAHTYASLYGIPCTGLRFFTVYGPWGRPDMAYFLFTKAIVDAKPIKVFNHGKMRRDFTYIDDIVEGVFRISYKIPTPNPVWNGDNPDPAISYAPYKLYNIGNNNAVELMYFIEVLEENLGKKAIKDMLPMQAGDVQATYANIDDLLADIGYKPSINIEEGISRFVKWYKIYTQTN